MTRILVTGGTGFIGRHLALALEARGDRVLTLDAAHGDDVTDAISVRAALAEFAPGSVVHLAALLTPECESDPPKGVAVNCVGTAVVLHESLRAGAKSVVFTSSIAAIQPRSVYGATKAFGEHLAAAIRLVTSGRLIGLRLGWVYGQARASGWNDLQEVIEGFALERPEVSYPDYGAAVDWTHIDDAVAGVIACLDHAPPTATVYDLAGDLRPVPDAVRHLTGRFPGVRAKRYLSKTPPTAWSALDGSLIERDTGFRPRVLLEEGLDRTVQAIRREHGLTDMEAVQRTT